MTRLFYKIKNGYGELTDSSYGSGGDVVISVDGAADGTIIISEHSLKLKDGRVSIDQRSLQDGAVLPILISDKGSFRLEPFLKEDGKITALPTEDWVVRKMLNRLGRIETELHELMDSFDEIKEGLGIYRLEDPDGE